MIAKLLETITGKDDLERVAWRENLADLNAYLKTRRVWVPRRPKRFLDASNFTQEELLKLIEEESKDLSGDSFEPWIQEIDGKNRLPVFSSLKKMEVYSGKVSQRLNKVFSLGGVEMLIEDLAKNVDIDFVDPNLSCGKSWEIGIRKNAGELTV